MARQFDAASSQCLRRTSGVLTAVPITMACWFNVLDLTSAHFLITLVDYSAGASGESFTLAARGDLAGDYVNAMTFQSVGGAVYAESTIAYTANTWHHACGVFAAVDDRRAFLDGGNKGTETTSRTPTGIDHTSIGNLDRADDPATYTDGSIAEAAIWNVALTDAEVAELATGRRPSLVHPQNLVVYWPLVRDWDSDIMAGYQMTPINAPTISAHPPMLYGAPARFPYLPLISSGTALEIAAAGELARADLVARSRNRNWWIREYH